MRKTEDRLIIVDCGTIFAKNGNDRELNADISLKSLNMIGYDALNLGYNEFQFGIDYLEKAKSSIDLPLISSNLISKNGQILPWLKDHVIKNINGVRVAVVGLIPIDAQPYIEEAKIIPPEDAPILKDCRIKEKADVVILLSQLSAEATNKVLKQAGCIDLVILCNETDNQTTGEARVISCGNQRENMEYVRLTLKDDGSAIIGQRNIIKLDKSVALDEQINDLIIQEHHRHKRMLNAERQQKIEQERLKTLELSPEEFIEKYNTEKRTSPSQENPSDKAHPQG